VTRRHDWKARAAATHAASTSSVLDNGASTWGLAVGGVDDRHVLAADRGDQLAVDEVL